MAQRASFMDGARLRLRALVAGAMMVAFVTPLHAQTAADAAEEMRAAHHALGNGDYERTFDLVAPLADIGIAEGQHLLARLHLKREFAGYDAFEAFRLMSLAANQGLPIAQHDLAQMYRTGVGIEQDSLAAFSWHLRAARQRFSLSERAIAAMYQAGEGVQQDDNQANRWRQRANENTSKQPSPPKLAAAKSAAAAPKVTSPPAQPTASPPAPEPPRTKPSRTAPVEARTDGRKYRIQLGAFRYRKIAERIRGEIIAALPAEARARFDVEISTTDKDDGNGPLHRIYAGPVDTLATGQFICSQVTARLPRQGCFVLRQRK